MSRTAPRALLLAPLLAAALGLGACGGDEAPTAAVDGTTPTAAAATSPEVAVTSPDGGAAATSPDAPAGDAAPAAGDAAPKDDEAPKGDDAPESGAAPADDRDVSIPDTPTKDLPEGVRPSADRAQNQVLQTLAVLETCWSTKASYATCQPPKVLGDFGGTTTDTKRPKTGQVAITNASKDTFKIIATDKAGTRWVLAKSRKGVVTRKCKKKSGKACNPASW